MGLARNYSMSQIGGHSSIEHGRTALNTNEHDRTTVSDDEVIIPPNDSTKFVASPILHRTDA